MLQYFRPLNDLADHLTSMYIMNHIFYLDDGYICGIRHCPFNDNEDIDWGYFTKDSGDCKVCKERCSNDDNCGGVECGEKISYCSWWGRGICIDALEKTIEEDFYETCTQKQGEILFLFSQVSNLSLLPTYTTYGNIYFKTL